MARRKEPIRGEIYLCDFDPARGSEQIGTRPAVVVERTAFSMVEAKRHVLVAAITTSPKCERLPFCVAVEPNKENGLKKRCFINTSHLHSFSKDRLQRRLGRLTSESTDSLNQALRLILDL